MIALTFLDGGGPHERSRRHEVLALRRPAAGRRLGGSLPRCLLSDARAWSEDCSDSPSSPGGHHELSLDSLIAAIGATGQQPADADAHRYIFAAATMALREQESGRALTDADIHYYRGIALAVQKKLEQAVAEFAAAIRLRPHYAEAHNELGNVLRDQGKREEAIAEFRAAIRIDPDRAEPSLQPRLRPGSGRGKWTRRSPNSEQRSGSIPTTPSAAQRTWPRPARPRGAGRSDRRVPRRDPAQSRLRRRPTPTSAWP